MASSYASYYTQAVAGASSLAEITDATSASDAAGTDCDKSYWESHAYDQIRQIFLELGSSPGTGVTGDFILNNDAADDSESSSLYFYRGPSVAASYVKWDSATAQFVFSNNIVGETSLVTVGTSSTRLGGGYFDDMDINTLNVNTDATFVDAEITGTLTLASFDITGETITINSDAVTAADVIIEAYRGAAPVVSSYIRWYETSGRWQISEGGGDATYYDIIHTGYTGSITTDLFNSTVYAGSSGDLGVADTIARSDHTHSGGTLDVSGTVNDTFIINSGSTAVDTDIQFYSSTYYLRRPYGQTYFQLSHSLYPAVDDSINLGSASFKWKDLHISGSAYIGTDLTVDGSIVSPSTDSDFWTVSSGNAGGLKVLRSDSDYAELIYDSAWKVLDPISTGTADEIATLAATQTLTNKTLSAPTVSGIILGTVEIDENNILFDANVASGTSGEGYMKVGLSTGTSYTYLGYTGSSWGYSDAGKTTFYPLATTNKAETLTSKTLTSPIINSGTLSGTLSVTGNITTTGDVTVTKNSGNTIAFSTGTTGSAPFTVTKAVSITDDLPTITNLNADLIDGIQGDDILYATTSGGDYVMNRNIDTNGFLITGIDLTPDAHEASHISGGADEISGILGSGVTGTVSGEWRVGTDTSATTNILYLGNTNSYFMQINSTTDKTIGLGGSGISIVPGDAPTNTNQDLGIDGKRWRTAYIAQCMNLKPLGAAEPTSGLDDGSVWVTDASSTNGGISKFRIELNGTKFTIATHEQKTDLLGTTGAWSVNGALSSAGYSGSTGTFSGAVGVDSLTASGTVHGDTVEAAFQVTAPSGSITNALSVGSLSSGGAVAGASAAFTGTAQALNFTASGQLGGDTLSVTSTAAIGGNIQMEDASRLYLSSDHSDNGAYFVYNASHVSLHIGGVTVDSWPV